MVCRADQKRRRDTVKKQIGSVFRLIECQTMRKENRKEPKKKGEWDFKDLKGKELKFTFETLAWMAIESN